LKDLLELIGAGRVILFLGAGASWGARDSKGSPLLLGDELAKALCAASAIPYSGESLQTAYAAARLRMGNKLDDLLRELYSKCKPTDGQLALAGMPWPRIYTLNIDDSFDRALANRSPQKVKTLLRDDWIIDRDQTFDRLDYIKLNGSVHHLDRGLVFSPQEYGLGSAANPLWYGEVAQDFFNQPFLFVGTRLQEPLFFHQVERLRPHAENAPTGYVITPKATEVEKEFLRGVGLIHIEGTLADLAKALGDRFPKPPSPFDVAVVAIPQLKGFAAAVNKGAYATLFQLSTRRNC
jgi:hypothetical protein